MGVNFDNILNTVIEAVLPYSNSFRKLFIVRNVFGRIRIFIENLNIDLTEINSILQKSGIGDGWIENIETVLKDSLIYNELLKISQKVEESEEIYTCERRLTRLNWFTDKQADRVDAQRKSKIVSFYSYKGGVGRTTSLVASALEVVRRGFSVVLVDFDIEAPGLATLFFSKELEEEYKKVKGVVDFLLEANIRSFDNEYDLDDYFINITDSSIIGSEGGRLAVVPAGAMSDDNAENYVEKLSRLDFNLKTYTSDNSPITLLFSLLERKFEPDFIFIDCRTGINDIGGLALTKLSDMIVMVFYGNSQNMFGLRMIAPILKELDKPLLLVNSPIPTNETDKQEEIDFYVENSYDIFCSYFYEDDDVPEMTDKSALHYPVNVLYNSDATIINNPSKIVSLLINNKYGNPYIDIAEYISRIKSKPEDSECLKTVNGSNIHIAMSRVMPEFNMTAAGEHEFSSEADLRKRFYPRKDYKFIFEHDRFLILGEKGVGKTTLFTALSFPDYAKHLAEYCGISTNDFNTTEWLKGIDNSNEFPTDTNFTMLEGHDFSQLKNYWMCLFIRSLIRSNKNIAANCDITTIKRVSECSIPEINEISSDFGFIEKLEAWLSTLQQYCERNNKKINVIYDYFDLLLPDIKLRGKLIAALISFWFTNLNRYKNIRSKIFLRQDIFDREVESSLTDKLKIKNYSVAIKWEYDQLLNIIWKRMLEEDADVEIYFKECLKDKYLLYKDKGNPLGYIPMFDKDANWLLLDKFFGKYMGSNNKAFPYNWITYHLSDTNDNISPRSIIMLFAFTAREQLEDKNASETLIRPYNMEKSMAKVSEARLQDLKEEYPTLSPIFNNLKEYERQFPIEENRLKEALKKILQTDEGVQKIIERLMEIGVLKSYKRRTKNDIPRYHIPDIYLVGMGLTRKGPSYHKVFKKK